MSTPVSSSDLLARTMMQGLSANLNLKQKSPNATPPAPPKRVDRSKTDVGVSIPEKKDTEEVYKQLPVLPRKSPRKSPRRTETEVETSEPTSTPPPAEKKDHRIQVAMEISTTEKSYCKSLQTIVSDYLHPLQLDSSILKKKKLEAIFMNIEEIMLLHLPMLHDLEKCVQKDDAHNIGEIFVKTASYNFSLYKSYCAKYAEALICLADCIQSSSKFASFVQSRDGNLDSLLIQPVQRIPRYRLLFGELLKYTPKDHPDYEPSANALRCIEEIAIHVNESVRDKENQDKLLQVQQSFTNKAPTIVDPSRRFIREGVLVKMCRRTPKRRYFFLFSDLLIYGVVNESSVNSKVNYTFHRALDLKQVKVEDIPEADGMENAFQIRSNQKSFAVFAESQEIKNDWISDIRLAKNLDNEIRVSQGEDDIAPVWVPDKLVKKCMQCQGRFTTINRRHHCRKCGDLVCGSCSSKKFKLPNIGKLCRVCDICFGVLNGNADLRKEPEKNFSAQKKQYLANTATKKFGGRATVRGSTMNMLNSTTYSSLLDAKKEKINEEESIPDTLPEGESPTMKTKKPLDESFSFLAELKTNSNRHRIRKSIAEDDDLFVGGPPPPLNEDGFFEYESDEEAEVLPPLPPRSAPPPPPPPRH